MLERQTDIEVIGEAGDGEQAVELSGELRPDVVLMDIRMPGSTDSRQRGGCCRPPPVAFPA